MIYRVCFLEITSYIGWSFGAQHYYGSLWCNGQTVELEHPLTAEEAAAINRESMFDWMYKAGRPYRGYTSKQDIIRQARREWKKHFPNADILVLGSRITAEPQRVIYGPPEWKTKVNAWWVRLGEIGRDTWNRESRDISDAFWKFYLATTVE